MLRPAENPFAIERVGELPFDFGLTDVGNIEALVNRLFKSRCRAAIVGKRGTGKTTLLKELHCHLQASGQRCHFVVLPRERRLQKDVLRSVVATGQQGALLLVDGIERLPWLRRLSFLRNSKPAAGLVVTVHRKCRLPTLIRTTTSPELLERLLDQLDQSDAGTKATAAQLLKRHRGNMRLAMRDLYDMAYDDA